MSELLDAYKQGSKEYEIASSCYEYGYQQGRADAIDECIGAVNSEYIENINLVPYRLVKRLEQLKEQTE